MTLNPKKSIDQSSPPGELVNLIANIIERDRREQVVETIMNLPMNITITGKLIKSGVLDSTYSLELNWTDLRPWFDYLASDRHTKLYKKGTNNFSFIFNKGIAREQLIQGATADDHSLFNPTSYKKTITIPKEYGLDHEDALEEKRYKVDKFYFLPHTGEIFIELVTAGFHRNRKPKSGIFPKRISMKLGEIGPQNPRNTKPVIILKASSGLTGIHLIPKNHQVQQHINSLHGESMEHDEPKALGFIPMEDQSGLSTSELIAKIINGENIRTDNTPNLRAIKLERGAGNRESIIADFDRPIGYIGLISLYSCMMHFDFMMSIDTVNSVVEILRSSYDLRVKYSPKRHDEVMHEQEIINEGLIEFLNHKLAGIKSPFLFEDRTGYPALTLDLRKYGYSQNNLPDTLKTNEVKIAGKFLHDKSRVGPRIQELMRKKEIFLVATMYGVGHGIESGYPFPHDKTHPENKKFLDYWIPYDAYDTPVFLKV